MKSALQRHHRPDETRRAEGADRLGHGPAAGFAAGRMQSGAAPEPGCRPVERSSAADRRAFPSSARASRTQRTAVIAPAPWPGSRKGSRGVTRAGTMVRVRGPPRRRWSLRRRRANTHLVGAPLVDGGGRQTAVLYPVDGEGQGVEADDPHAFAFSAGDAGGSRAPTAVVVIVGR